ncbi:zinc carboxypeptidase [Cephus cinctus]|uniref:Zinc carboxypeptidase A 1 n=1 Tax=Cephus cinctus TaxID=211228 RepID=A0AAJ7CBC0_CEPCN|nr:zinc carboxypeptidase [Cephus cinctus]
MGLRSSIGLVLTILAFQGNSLVRYDGYRVYRVWPTTTDQLDILHYMEDNVTDGVSFWTSPAALNTAVDVMIAPEREPETIATFETMGLSYSTFISDVQTLINNENPNGLGRDGANDTMNWTSYHTLDVIYSWLDQLAETYPNLVQVIVAGESYEGRLVKGIKITFNEEYPGVFVEGGIHAREWISPATVTYLINEILHPTSVNHRWLFRAHNWFIFPNTNPDGYVYTHTTDRMWRKTRRPYANGCFGADPNRNWDYHWLENHGASNYSCAETYAGAKPFSEPEIKALADYIDSVRTQFYVYLSIHSYSQLILLPYGYTYEHLDNYKESMIIGTKAAEALAKRYGTNYTVGATAETIYVASGSSTDYVKGIYKTAIVYCYELRDTGAYGFLLPPEQIVPNSLEFLDSLVALFGEARKLGYPESTVSAKALN